MSEVRPNVPTVNPKYAAIRLKIRRSRIQGWGVFAAETIPAVRKVIEYTGERIGVREAMKRIRRALRSSANPRISLFYLSRSLRIDAVRGGSGAEYINHCCEPNLNFRRIRGHILFFSRRKIRAGEELTFHYALHPETLRIACRCGAATCPGEMNAPKKFKQPRRSGRRRRAGRGRQGRE